MKVLRTIIVFFFNFLLLSVPLYFRFVNEELFEFNKMILVYGLTTTISFFWILRMIFHKKLIFKKTALDIPILLFLISQIISTVISIHPRTSLLGYYSRFNGGLLSTISYIVLYYAFVSNIKKKDLTGILISTFLSGAIVSIYGILEHFGHSLSCLFVPGVKDFSVECWKQDVQSRVFASFGQPNWLAAYVITLLPLGIALSIQKKYKINQKIFFSIVSILLFIVLIFTRSRSGLVGLGGGIIFSVFIAIFLNFKKDNNQKSKIDRKFFYFIASGILISSAIFGTMFSPSISEIMNNKKESQITIETSTNSENTPVENSLETGGTDSGKIRQIVWKGGLQIWKRYPIFGSGVETFAYSYYLDRPREHNDVSEWDFLYNKAHNELINILANTGIFGLLTYLSILITFGLLVIKKSITNQNDSFISLAILIGIINLSISNFFGFSTVAVNVLMFIFFGISMVLNTKIKSKNLQKPSNRIKSVNDLSAEQYFFISISLITALVISIKIYNYWDADRLFYVGKTNFKAGNYLVGVQKQLEATQKSPHESLFYDNLSDNYAKLAVELINVGDATAASAVIDEAIKASDLALENNNRHLNFYKTRSRVFVTLGQINEEYLIEAQNTLNKSIELAPTDPKLVYTQGVIDLSLGKIESGTQLIEKSIELKPNYEKARWKAAEIYENNGQISKAIEQLKYILENISPNDEKTKEKISQLEAL